MQTIRSINGVSIVPSELNELYTLKNIIDYDSLGKGCIASDGSIDDNFSDWVYTINYMPFDYNDNPIYAYSEDTRSKSIFVAFYDENKNFLYRHVDSDLSTTPKKLSGSEGAVSYARLAFHRDEAGFKLFREFQAAKDAVQYLYEGNIKDGALKARSTDFIAENILKSDKFILGYYMDKGGHLASLYDWVVYNEPIQLNPYETLCVVTGNPFWVSMYLADGTYERSEAVYPTDGKGYYTNSRAIPAFIRLSLVNTQLYNTQTQKAYFATNATTPRVMVESDDAMATAMGEYNSLKNTPDEALSSYSADQFVYFKGSKDHGRIVKKLCITSGSNRSLTVAVGFVDQRGWFVQKEVRTYSVSAGENRIDTSSDPIYIPAGYTLAVNVKAGESYDSLHTTGTKWTGEFGKFTDLVNFTTSNFSGLPFVVMITEDEPTESVRLSGEIGRVSSDVAPMANIKDLVYKTDGTAYRQYLDDNMDLYYVPVIPRKFACIGNSITMHGYNETVNWLVSDRGMAASRVDYDYCHRLRSYFQEHGGSTTLESQYGFWRWETASDRDSTLNYLDNVLSDDLDLVVIQLGENASDLTTLYEDFKSLIAYVRNLCPRAFLVVVGESFGSTEKDDIKKKACADTNVAFADVSGYLSLSNYKAGMGTTIYKSDGTTFTVTNGGVAKHPGNVGMRCIAQAILRVLTENWSLVLADNYS